MTIISDVLKDFSFKTKEVGEGRIDPLNERTRMTALDTIAILWRAFLYILPFKWRFVTRFLLAWITYFPGIVYPWILTLVIDHVILGIAVGDTPTRYPPFFQPFVNLIDGKSPAVMMIFITSLCLVMVSLVGGFGTGRQENHDTDGRLAEGHDQATRSENEANIANSASSGLFGWADFRFMLRLTQALNHYYRSQLFERIKSLPMSILDDQRIGDTVFRVMYDTPSISRICYDVVLRPTVSIINLIIILYVMHYSFKDVPWLVIVGILSLPATFLTTLPFAGFMRRRVQASRASGSDTTGTIEEGMNNILAVQSLGGSRKQRQRFDRDSLESFGRYRGAFAANVIVNMAVSFSGEAITLGATYIIAISVINGTVSAGAFGVLLFYYYWIVKSGRDMANLWIVLQQNAVGVRRVFFLMDLPVEKDLGKKDLPPITQGVKVENAGLVYPDGRRALNNVSFEGRMGEVVAIVGPTGAGKTSLAYLVPHYHTATEGRVLIDGVDINEVTLTSLRPQVSYVFQETHLFSDSVADNIRYSYPEATQEEIERAAKMAGAHDFITRLPDGYNTRLKRSSLSVGQKQRISIARGLVRPSRILILDEPTSAVDPETEKYLVHSLEAASKDNNQLVIIIAHRLSTIRHADKILFMDHGKIVESGTHEELMEINDGAYRRFVELQTLKAT